MSIIFEERWSDSPYIETITQGYTTQKGTTIRPAECHWHMVFVRVQGQTQTLAVGPLPESGEVSYGEGAEILWIKFKLGTFMPHLPPPKLINCEMLLPEAVRQSFWLHSTAWQLPNYENVETFVERLVRQDVLAVDPVVKSVLQNEAPEDLASRTIRHRFLRTTGLSQKHIQQAERASEAAARLSRGVPIMDVVFDLGYYDQAHLTHSLKRFTGLTPAQQSQRSSG